jgi:biopolymer transport protein ExbB
MATKWLKVTMLSALLVPLLIGVAMAQSTAEPAAADHMANMMDNFSWGTIIKGAFFQAGAVGFTDCLLLVCGSIAAVAMIIQFGLEIRRSILLPELTVAQVKTMFDERRFREALEFSQKDPSFIASVIHAGLIEAANGYDAMEKAMVEAAEERAGRLFRKVELLNLLGNITPMLGLFGTVYGMMLVFSVISTTEGGASAAQLGGAIMVKLFCTFLGLLAAIPSLTAYSLYKSHVDRLSIEATLVATELLSNFKPTRAAQQRPAATQA